MKTGAKILRGMAVASVLIFSVLISKGYGAKFVIGCGFGYSEAFKESRIATFASFYRTASPRECLNPTIGIMFKGHLSVTAEMLYQKYDAVDHSDGTVVATWHGYNDFFYFGGALEFRFFEDIRKSWNPYVSVGFYGLFDIGPFGPGQEGYPATNSINVALGTRIRLAGPLYLNPRVAYVSGISSLSLRAALDLIL